MYDRVKGSPSLSRILFKAKAKGLLCHRRGSTVSVYSGGQWITFFRMSPFTVCRVTPKNPRMVYRSPGFFCDECGGAPRMEHFGCEVGSPSGIQLVCKSCMNNRSGKTAAKAKAKPVVEEVVALPARDGPNQAVCSIIGAS